jgi:hypothetical protein
MITDKERTLYYKTYILLSKRIEAIDKNQFKLWIIVCALSILILIRMLV